MAPHNCSQGDRILKLELTEKQMAKDIQEIKETGQKTQEAVIEVQRTLNAFILTAPQNFADKKEFTDFKNGINSKIAWMSGAWAVVVVMVTFIFNKYF